MKIVTLTMNPAIDATCEVENVKSEDKLRTSAPSYEPGGGGINVSRAIRKLGGESRAIYPEGGFKGNLLRKLIEDEGVTHTPVEFEGMTRENLTVNESSSKAQYRFTMPGPEVGRDVQERCLEALVEGEAPEIIVASGSLPRAVDEDFYARVACKAKELGAKLVVDTKGLPLYRAVEQGVYMIKPNMREVNDLTGEEIDSEEKLIRLAGEIFDKKRAEVIVISLGAGGALFIHDGKVRPIRTPTVPIRSKVGAGDSMVAGMVLKVVEGWDAWNAAVYGVAAGAAAVQTPGTELCRREDTEELYERIKKEL